MHKHISDNNLFVTQSVWFLHRRLMDESALVNYVRYLSLFDEGMETIAIFLDISKAFDTVWHKGLI